MVTAGVYRIKNAESGTYLDASLKKPGVVHGWESRPENRNQQWDIRERGDKWTIKNVQTGDYIHPWKLQDSIDVKTRDDPTLVRFEGKDGAIAIFFEDTDKCIDLDEGRRENGTGVNVWGFSGQRHQLWHLEPVGGGHHGGGHQGGYQPGPSQQQPISDYRGAVQPGTYFIRNVHTGTALDLAGGAANDGTRVIGYSAGSGNNQKWTLEPGLKGYRLKNAQSGTYCGYQRHESPTDGVLLTGNNNSVEWDVRQADQGYQLFLAGTNYVLDLASGDASDGAKICLWTNKGGNNQKWNFQQSY